MKARMARVGATRDNSPRRRAEKAADESAGSSPSARDRERGMSSGMSSGAAWPEKGQMCVCESRCFVTKQLDPRQDLSGAADAIISRTLEPGQMEWVYEVRRMPGDTERLRGLTSEGWLSFVAQDGTVLIRKAELVERQARPALPRSWDVFSSSLPNSNERHCAC